MKELMKKKYKKICLICYKEFFVSFSQIKRKFCSIECRYKGHRKRRYRKICCICNKKFYVIPCHRFTKNKKVYCSVDCRYKGQIKKRYKKTCPICNNKFYVTHCNKKETCSRECRYKKATKRRFKKKCPTCKNIFYQGWLKNKYNQIYCSKKCIPIWNKGLTKKTDKRVLKYGIKSGKFISNYVKKHGAWCKGKKLGPSPLKGKKLSKKHKKKLSNAKLGKKSWNFGLKKETNEKILKYFSLRRMGKNNPNWNGKTKKVQCHQCKALIIRTGQHFEKRKKNFCSRKCFHKYQKGENHPSWNGGISFLPYDSGFNEILKNFIRKRDDYKCQNLNCGVPEKECLQFVIHHIDYDKNNSDSINLIALCNSCNMKANFNRKYWQNYYENIQIKRKVHEFEKI